MFIILEKKTADFEVHLQNKSCLWHRDQTSTKIKMLKDLKYGL